MTDEEIAEIESRANKTEPWRENVLKLIQELRRVREEHASLIEAILSNDPDGEGCD